MPKQNRKKNPSLEVVVGRDVYHAWVDMLSHLVPDGRTHRLAVVIAGMLHYTIIIASQREGSEEDENDIGNFLYSVWEAGDPEEMPGVFTPYVKTLFADAKVKYQRVSRKGEEYSIIDHAIDEFICWEYMPWE